jgi:hypothetical protein
MDSRREFPKHFKYVLFWLLLPVGFIVLCFSYVSTEITTSLYQQEITNWPELCKVKDNPDFKYIKLVKYIKYKKEARMYCIYEDSTKNVSLDINYTRGWQVILSQKMSEDGSLYWPVYV